jgi:prepilin-type N-terminal cleavage/methylation domain-containing protein
MDKGKVLAAAMSLRKKNSVRGAFTMVELLIALVVVGILLAGLTVALNASIVNYNKNEAIYRGINEARQALTRMTTQIRTGLVDPNNIANEQVCTVRVNEGAIVKDYTFYFDSANKRLCLEIDETPPAYTLCENVSAITFKKELNGDTPHDVKSVRISITVSDGGVKQTLAGAAVVRKVLD